MFAEVVVNLPLDRSFDYVVPDELRRQARPGVRVVVPFGHRRLIGFIAALRDRSAIAHPKAIARVLDETPILDEQEQSLARWMAGRYGCSLGEALSAMVPPTLKATSGRGVAQPAATAIESSSEPAHISDPLRPLTDEQRPAFDAMRDALQADRHRVMLLHGITGSGKTELYLRAIAVALEQGRSALCLVPEIVLTPQAVDRFRERFGPSVVLWHSRLSASQRHAAWRDMAAGRSRVIVGTRSAVFAPLQRIGLIILDEEHDPSYKQDQTPRYHARDVAIERARLANALVVLGSATPSVESFYRATKGDYQLLELTKRVEGRSLPPVELIDMRQEFLRGRRMQPLSPKLQNALEQAAEQHEQAILLLNRRGFARVIACPACGVVQSCSQCSVPLIYHTRPPKLLCHYCGVSRTPPEICPACDKSYVRFRGSGTERIESELHRLFPSSNIGRMDKDTTKGRDMHRELYDALKAHTIEMLVGTQMVAKGFDLPKVTLVGVVSADTSLNLPDFRAGERTFTLLTQVAGRAGRGDRPGQVLVQTYCPEHYAIQAASRHNYRQFYDAEIEIRRRSQLPPFAELVELTVQGKDADAVRGATEELAKTLRVLLRGKHVTVLGPAPHRVETIRHIVRWRLVLKAASSSTIMDAVRSAVGESRRFKGLPVAIDVDPL